MSPPVEENTDLKILDSQRRIDSEPPIDYNLDLDEDKQKYGKASIDSMKRLQQNNGVADEALATQDSGIYESYDSRKNCMPDHLTTHFNDLNVMKQSPTRRRINEIFEKLYNTGRKEASPVYKQVKESRESMAKTLQRRLNNMSSTYR